MNLEELARSWVTSLEQRKTRMPYSVVWCLLGLGCAFVLFGFLDHVWAYYLEGLAVIAVAVVTFVIEACWRRIAELKTFLSEYVEAERRVGVHVESVAPKA